MSARDRVVAFMSDKMGWWSAETIVVRLFDGDTEADVLAALRALEADGILERGGFTPAEVRAASPFRVKRDDRRGV